jgi:hypothetical protein
VRADRCCLTNAEADERSLEARFARVCLTRSQLSWGVGQQLGHSFRDAVTFYSPFAKPIVDLDAADLAVLRSVAEGWYVEYKRLVPSASSIAKSISAFANQFGGWLFYGIEENADGSRTAGAFPGVASTEVQASETRIRDAVRNSVNPIPFFETRVLHGPCAEPPLVEGRAVIIVRVPAGANPPYLHSSGRMYRRVADSSDPCEITDRHTLDTLVERARSSHARLAATLGTELELSKGESEAPYACLFFLPDPLGDRGTAITATFEAFAAAMRQPPGANTPGVPFDNVFTSAHGFIARQVADNDPQSKVLTWDYRLDGSSIVTMPLRRGLPAAPGMYLHQNRHMQLCRPAQLQRILDTNALLNSVAACIATHWRLCETFGVPKQTWVKIRLENVWRLVPFFDTADFIAFVEEFGVPIIQQSKVHVPPAEGLPGLLMIEPRSGDEDGDVLAPAVRIASELFFALGFPIARVGRNPQEFIEAGDRGGAVLSGRGRS